MFNKYIIPYINNIIMLYNYFLKCYGLKDILTQRKKNVDENGNEIKQIEFNVDNDVVKENVIKEPKKFYQKKLVRFCVNWFYRFLIFCILIFGCIYPIIIAGLQHDWLYFASSSFSYMYLSQYIFGIFLHSGNHYNLMIEKFKKTKYIKYIDLIFLLIFFASLCLAIVPIFVPGYKIALYEITGKNVVAYVMLVIYMIIYRILVYNIIFSNGLLFVSTLYIHCKEIDGYEKILKNNIDENLMEMNINTMIKEYTEIKDNYGDSVVEYNNIFASIIIFGFIGYYFLLLGINTDYNDVFTYIDGCVCFVFQFAYIFAIGRITKNIGDIKDSIDSSKFVSIFLSKSEFVNLHGDTYDDYNKDLNVIDENKGSPLNKILSSRKMGKNAFVINNMEKINDNDDINKKIDYVKNVGMRGMISSIENGIILDWITLNTKLTEPWKRFVVLGFEINDSQLIQQLLSMAISILGLLELSKKIN